METRNPKTTTGDFSIIPDEIITGPLVQSLAINELKKLKNICRFFATLPKLDKVIEEKLRKSLKIAANLCNTFILKEGTVYIIGRSNSFEENTISQFNTPHQLTLPNKRPIVQIITGASYAFFLDDLGNPFAFGDYRESPLGVQSDLAYLDQPTPILFNDKNEVQPKIINIVTCRTHSAFIADTEKCYRADNYFAFRDRPKLLSDNNYYNNYCFNNAMIDKNKMNFFSITLPSNKEIAHVIPGSKQHTIYGDIEGNWFGIGDNFYNRLGLGENIRKVDKLTPIDFYGMITPKEKPVFIKK